MAQAVPEPLQPAKPDVRKGWTLSRFLLGLAFVWLVVFIVFRHVAEPGVPAGNDAMAHLFKIWYIGQHLAQTHTFPVWLPYWYEGTDLFKYYQPLFYLVATPFYLITKNIFVTYRIVTFVWIGLVSLAMYGVVYRRLGLFPAIIAAILYALSPPVIRGYFYVGLLPQAFSYIFLPLAFHFTLRLADEGAQRAKTVALLAVCWGLFILAHPMSAAFSMMATFVFITVYQATKQEERHPLVITRYLLSAALGIGVAALWFVPAYFGKIMPPTSGEAVFTTSVPLKELAGFVTGAATTNARYIPIALSILAIAGTFWRRTALAWGLAAMGAFTMIFALGVQTPLYSLVPLSSAIFPEYALFGACFAFAFLAGRLFERTIRNWAKDVATVVLIVAVVFIALVETQPVFTSIVNKPAPSDIIRLLDKAKTLPADGRVSMLGHSSAVLSYYPTVITGRQITEGFFYQGTNHYKEIANINDVQIHDYAPGYVHRKLAQWNTRYIMVHTATLAQDKAVIPPGYKKVATAELWNLFYQDKARSSFQIMTHDSIAIGKNPAVIALRYPWIVEGGLYVDDYDWKYLSQFKRIILSGFAFHDRKTAVDLITRLAESGRTVVIDLQDVESEFGTESVSFMNVLPIPVTTPRQISLTPARQLAGLPQRKLSLRNLAYNGEAWKAVVYTGLDASAYDVAIKGKTYSALGYKRAGAGKIYFAGLNLFFHNLLAPDSDGTALTDWLAGPPAPSLYMANFPVTSQAWRDDSVKFGYSSTKSAPVVVSTTWTENWHATIDGKPLKAYAYENMPLFFLPAGTHAVEMNYGTTGLEIFATLITVASVAIVLFILIRSVRRKNSASDTGI